MDKSLKTLIYNTYLFYNRFSASSSHDNHLHNSRFAEFYELEGLLSSTMDGAGLLLAESRFSRLLRVKSIATRQELGNVLICGPSRSGKTLLQDSQLLTWKHSAIVNDIKGELFAHTAGLRALYGDVYVFDPVAGVGNQYDPLQGREKERDLYASAKHLLYDPNDKDGAVFTQRATKMLTQLFLAARLEGSRPIPYVGRLVNFGLNEVARMLNAVSPLLARKFLDAEFKPQKDFEDDKFRSSAWGTLSARLYALLTEDIVRCFDGSDFSAKDLLFSNKPITVYLRWHESELHSLGPIIRLVWESMINEIITAYDQAERKEYCQPVLLDIEEAGRTGIPNLPEHSSTVNGRGISLMIAVQSLSQLDGLYGRYRADTLRNNLDSQIYYRQASLETADYLERRLGKKSGFASSRTEHGGTETSNGEAERDIALMTAQKITQLGDEEIIGFHRHLPPFLAKRMDWRHFPELVRRRQFPPPPLYALPREGERPLPGRQAQSDERTRAAVVWQYVSRQEVSTHPNDQMAA